ncbi:MAG: peptidase U32 family protein [Deltaproteobacteria bacterium]|nr:peptidase U32 family protein [Candidatus Deferrimicrobiaceae bacterium]
MAAIELIASLASPRERAGTDLGPYDAVCLGNPYCRRVRGNFAEELSLLPQTVSGLRAEGKNVYVTSPAAPRGRDLPHVERLIAAAADAGAQALEVHNMGVLRILKEKGNPLPAHIGAFANVYTHLTAQVMREYGAVRVRPNAEVSLEEMEVLAREGGVEVEVLAHGKIPLGVTERCSLLSEAEDADPKCPSACEEGHWLTTRQWVLKNVGKGVLSGRDMCLLEHLPRLLSMGFTVFKIEGLYESAAYRSEVGRVYREALELAASGKPYGVRPVWADALRRHSREGFCNGYFFGKTGRLYVGTVLQEDKPKV